MCTVYQLHPQKSQIHDIYKYDTLKDALLCARRLLKSHWKTILVDIRTDSLRTYVGEPGGNISQMHSPEKVLQTLCNARLA